MDRKKRTVAYTRISDDRGGAGLGVARQLKECRDLAARLGLVIAPDDVFTDNSISAFGGKLRPGYQELLAAMRRGEVGTLLTWHPDRLHRRPIELEEFIDVVDSQGIAIHTVSAGEYDLSTPAGRAVARTVGAWARYESEQKAKRIKSQKDQSRRAGKRLGGYIPWAFSKVDGVMTPDPDLEPVIVSMYQRYVAGTGVPTFRDELNRAGHIVGAPWTTSGLQSYLDRCAAFAVLPDGEGGWLPAVNHLRVAGCDDALFAAYWNERERRRRRRAPKTRVGQWMLAGLAICGSCGNRMSVNTFQKVERSRVQCSRQKTSGTCPGGGHSVGRPWLERTVGLALYSPGWSEALLAVLSGTEVESEDLAGAEERVRDLDRRLDAGERVRHEQVTRLLRSPISPETYEDLVEEMDRDLATLAKARREAVAERDRIRAARGTVEALSNGGMGQERLFRSLGRVLADIDGTGADPEALIPDHDAFPEVPDAPDVARWNRVIGEVLARVLVDRDSVTMIPTSTAERYGAQPITMKRQRRGRSKDRSAGSPGAPESALPSGDVALPDSGTPEALAV